MMRIASDHSCPRGYRHIQNEAICSENYVATHLAIAEYSRLSKKHSALTKHWVNAIRGATNSAILIDDEIIPVTRVA